MFAASRDSGSSGILLSEAAAQKVDSFYFPLAVVGNVASQQEGCRFSPQLQQASRRVCVGEDINDAHLI